MRLLATPSFLHMFQVAMPVEDCKYYCADPAISRKVMIPEHLHAKRDLQGIRMRTSEARVRLRHDLIKLKMSTRYIHAT